MQRSKNKIEEERKWIKLLSSKRLDTLLSDVKKDKKKEKINIWNEPRNPFEKDCDRIIYSYPFRRLQNKTQVIPFPAHDFVHTRLTHSLEVSTVGRSFGKMLENFLIVKRKLNINYGEIPAIITATCLAHDIGNPPFGHSGEDSISEYFKFNNPGEHTINVSYRQPTINSSDQVNYYGFRDKESEIKAIDLQTFEGNAMGFRVLASIQDGGMNLTCATLAAFAKYPRESYLDLKLEHKFKYQEKRASQKKFGFFFPEREIFKKIANEVGLVSLSDSDNHYTWARHPIAFLMEAADDICYSIIDFEDGCRQKRISYTCTNRCNIDGCDIEKTGEEIIKGLASLHERYSETVYNKLQSNTSKISYLRGLSISVLIQECFKVFEIKYLEILNGKFDTSLIDCINSKILTSLKQMKALVKNGVYQSNDVIETEATGFEVIGGLINSFVSVTDMCLNCSVRKTI
ncbi:MAG: dNTP triphosphohydrolase [Saprospiraceae bacterium]|nr:dNTP triphosphohydrolase [Saprospiraceae bacterium]